MMRSCLLDNLRIKPQPWQMSKGQAWQEQRVKNDEKRKADLQYVFEDQKDMERARWNEALEAASLEKRLKFQLEEMKTEITLCNESLTALRRAQLEQLLAKEEEKYKKELNTLGLTIYKDRM